MLLSIKSVVSFRSKSKWFSTIHTSAIFVLFLPYLFSILYLKAQVPWKGCGNMSDSMQSELRERYLAAVNQFVQKIKDDSNVVAVIVSGSLAYDVLWEKSDIDMSVVVRDQVLHNTAYSIIEDGIIMNISLFTRSAFKRELEGSMGGSFFQSYLAKGMVVYCTDDSLAEAFEDMKVVGRDDIAHSAFILAARLLGTLEKIEKWLVARKDALYAQYYLLKAAESVAALELCLAGEPIGRDAIQKAYSKNPAVISPYYQEAMGRHLSEREIEEAVHRLYSYLDQHLDTISAPVLSFMADQEVKTGTLIAKHFGLEPHFIVHAFDYLADKGIIERVSQTIRITPKGKQVHEELGYLYIRD